MASLEVEKAYVSAEATLTFACLTKAQKSKTMYSLMQVWHEGKSAI